MSPKPRTQTQEIPAMLDGNRQLIGLADALAPYIVASVRRELIKNPIAHVCSFRPHEISALKANVRFVRIAATALIVMAVPAVARAVAFLLQLRNGIS